VARRRAAVTSRIRPSTSSRSFSGASFSLRSADSRWFDRVAEAIAFDTVIADEIAAQLNESHVAVRAQRTRDSDRFRRELTALEPKEDQLTELLIGGTLDEAAYKRQLQRIREQRADSRESSTRPTTVWTMPTF
jgi:hypothetical protein